MSNKRMRNKKEMIDPKTGLTVYRKDRADHSRKIAYPAKFKKVAGRWIAKGVKGRLSGRAKELNIVGLK